MQKISMCLGLWLIVAISCPFADAFQAGSSPPKGTRFVLVVADADCSLFVDDDRKRVYELEYGKPERLTLGLGEHVLRCESGAYSQNYDIRVQESDPPQRVQHVAFADGVAAFAAKRTPKTPSDAPAKQSSAADSTGSAGLDHKNENAAKMRGRWVCKIDTGLKTMDGREGGSYDAPTAARVLVAEDLSLLLDVDAIENDPHMASGKVTEDFRVRLANRYELNGRSIGDRLTMSQNPACFNWNHNRCLQAVNVKMVYDMDDVDSATDDTISIRLGAGRCIGDCSGDGILKKGKILKFNFDEDHPGFTWGDTLCKKE